MVIRNETKADYAAVKLIHDKAFGHDLESRLIDNLRRSEGFDKGMSFVAELDGKVVGHILFTPVSIESPVGSASAWILAPLAVLKEYRGQKAGTALVQAGIDLARERGEKIILVYGHRFYERFGFTLAHEKGIFRPHPMRGELVRILELEQGAADRVMGVIRYPAPFKELVTQWY